MNQIHQTEILNFESKLNEYQKTADKYRIELEKLTYILSSKHDEVKKLNPLIKKSTLN
jgi:hypothetical protein